MDSALHQVIDDQLSTVAITASVAEAIAQLSQIQHPCLVVIEPESDCCVSLFAERHGIDLIARGLNPFYQTLSAHVSSPMPTVWVKAMLGYQPYKFANTREQWVEEFQFEPILALTRAAGYD